MRAINACCTVCRNGVAEYSCSVSEQSGDCHGYSSGTLTLTGGTLGKHLSSRQQIKRIALLLFWAVVSSLTLNFVSRRAISPCNTCGTSCSNGDDFSSRCGFLGATGAQISVPKSSSKLGLNVRCSVWLANGLCSVVLMTSSSGLDDFWKSIGKGLVKGLIMRESTYAKLLTRVWD